MAIFGNGNGGDTRDRLTRIETMLELRMKQGEEFMKEFGALRENVNRLHDELGHTRGLPARVQDVEKAHSETVRTIERYKNKAIGMSVGVGLPVTGLSIVSAIERIMGFLRGPH